MKITQCVLTIIAVTLIVLPVNGKSAERVWKKMSNESELRNIFMEKSKLKDPSSVQFMDVKVDKFKTPEGRIATDWCGKFNAKNSYGAYIGFRQFNAYNYKNKVNLIINESGDPMSAAMIAINAHCKGSGI